MVGHVLDRRAFIVGGVTILASPLRAEAQQQGGRIPRVGYATLTPRNVNVEAFEQGLREFGYVIGQNIVVDYRSADGHAELLAPLVAELVRSGVDVLFAANPHAIRAARQLTTAMPVIGIDLETGPVRAGWVNTLARPGGNITGFFWEFLNSVLSTCSFWSRRSRKCGESPYSGKPHSPRHRSRRLSVRCIP